MPGKVTEVNNLTGLSERQIPFLQKQYGKNIFAFDAENRFLKIVWSIVREPMFILLVIACSLYFILGNISEGIMMAVAMAIVTAISLYQEIKSSRALDALKQFTEPGITVIRDGKEQLIRIEELVPGDIMVLEEGMKIPADAVVLQGNDLSVNQSIVTGESISVEKNETDNHNELYQGATVESGKCIAKVTATGNNTILGKIGKAVAGYSPAKTLLQVQINKFVRRLALFGLMGFVIILFVNYLHYREFATSLLFALTLAMSAVPEEIPVAFSSFMALGAYKMGKLGIISRQPQIIENLGAVTVICLDKTGTITENRMQVKAIYDYKLDSIIDITESIQLQSNDIVLSAVLASELNPFDSMEKAIWELYQRQGGTDLHDKYKMIYEYPLEGRPPMMTHVYQQGNNKVIAAKGAAERILKACKLDDASMIKVTLHAQSLAAKGYRVIGVANATHTGSELPVKQDDFDWTFMGLFALYDPPKKNMKAVLKKITDAKIDIKLLTGDYAATAINIAGQVGILNHLQCINGEHLMNMKDEELQVLVKSTSVFARMFPDAKVKVINALKANKEIVAMTGDGVNDAPALKAADIGVAMGQKGTEAARQASDLILTDDNLEKMVTAISEGRKIFSNLVKAVRYIIAIHIPIILTASLPVALGWIYPNIFTPIHVIFLELIMGPTCSIFFENEPLEKDNMLSGPRNRTAGLFTVDELIIGIVQGLVITAGVLVLYYVFMTHHHSIAETRTIVFTTLILSNVFLTFASRSFTKTMYYTSRYKNCLAPVLIIISAIFLLLLHLVPAVRDLFHLAPITLGEFCLALGVALASVMWLEVYKTVLLKMKKK